MEIRLNKLISDSGLCSRREADKWIELGRVFVNGKRPEVGCKVGPKDKVRVDGQLLPEREESVYIVLNKPAGITCTTDTTERDNVIDFVNYPSRIFNVGRLDKPSEGLLILTNEGGIVNKILRAANDHEKEYEVMVDKPITKEFLTKMATGVPILGTVTKKCKIEQLTDNRFRLILTQGLNRQIRRMTEALGYNVLALKRTRVMNITLDKLPVGQWRFLTEREAEVMLGMLEESDGTAKASKGAGAGKMRVKPGARNFSRGGDSAGGAHSQESRSARGYKASKASTDESQSSNSTLNFKGDKGNYHKGRAAGSRALGSKPHTRSGVNPLGRSADGPSSAAGRAAASNNPKAAALRGKDKGRSSDRSSNKGSRGAARSKGRR
ncbi:MAG: 23S rRNA pseudouridine(2604) synthase RluF [Bacteroidales bacterium]